MVECWILGCSSAILLTLLACFWIIAQMVTKWHSQMRIDLTSSEMTLICRSFYQKEPRYRQSSSMETS